MKIRYLVLSILLITGCAQYAKMPDDTIAILPELILIPAGKYSIGASERDMDAIPVHSVYVDSFYIGKYEVTQAEWVSVMQFNPSRFQRESHPVETVSWYDAEEYVKRLTELTGETYRLPTEAEWEIACRAGTTAEYHWGMDHLKKEEYAWTSTNSSRQTHIVGRKKPNPLGIYDMYGNVAEWCSDWYHRDYYQISPTYNPKGPKKGGSKVIRGGSFVSGGGLTTCATRGNGNLSARVNRVGFRVVKEITPIGK